MTAQAEGPGAVAEEAARLFEALQRAAAGWTSGATDGGHGRADLRDGGDGADGATRGDATPLTCRTCPWCQVVAAVGRIRPETVQHLADAVSSLAAAVADVSGVRDGAGSSPSGGRPGHGAAQTARHRDVQHIDVTD